MKLFFSGLCFVEGLRQRKERCSREKIKKKIEYLNKIKK